MAQISADIYSSVSIYICNSVVHVCTVEHIRSQINTSPETAGFWSAQANIRMQSACLNHYFLPHFDLLPIRGLLEHLRWFPRTPKC
jgi:hypothetical protein